MRKRLQIVLVILLVLLFLFGAGNLVYSRIQARENAQTNLDAQQTVLPPVTSPAPSQESALPDSPPTVEPEPMPEPEPEPEPSFVDAKAEALLGVDLPVLQAVNEDVIAWIEIPDTPIAYPLLQGEDNDYYLNHTWKKEYNAGGSIFMECKNNADFSSFNTILYGHRMSDSSMFNSLRHYENEAYWTEHPRVYIVTEDGVGVYEIFAAMEVTVTDPVYWLITDQENYKQAMLDFCLENSAIETGLTPRAEDSILTLSTCTSLSISDDRWVVVAVKIGTVCE